LNTKRQRTLRWILGSLLFLGCVGLVLASYQFGWTATGFQGKTVWDWLQLLIVPFVLALVAIVFNQANTRTERQITQQRYEHDQALALDKLREDLLQDYLDRMSELLLEKSLRVSNVDAEVRNVARTRTISVLKRLDADRVESVFTFLRDAGLMDLSNPIISLKGADFANVNWSGAILLKANLSGAIFFGANLRRMQFPAANLSGAYFNGADLSGAIFQGTNLSGAFLAYANLSGAWLESTNLSGAYLRETNLGGVDFKTVDLRGAKFKDTQINRSKLTPEQIAEAIWDEVDPSL
jgi:uncharacterized protein YjbI with pentapeptide repeats